MLHGAIQKIKLVRFYEPRCILYHVICKIYSALLRKKVKRPRQYVGKREVRQKNRKQPQTT